MKCPNCGFENRPDARFCKNCRQPLQATAATQPSAPPAPPPGICPACGATAKPGARFCPRCGKPLPAAAAPQAPTPAAPGPYTQLPPTVPSMPPIPPQAPPPAQPPTYAQPPSMLPPPAAARRRGGSGWALWVALAAMFLCIVAIIVSAIVFRQEIAATLGRASATAPPTETPTSAPTPTLTPTPSPTGTTLPPTGTPEAVAPIVPSEPVFAVVGTATSSNEVEVSSLITVTVTVTNTGDLPFRLVNYQLVGQLTPFLELVGPRVIERLRIEIAPGATDSATFVLTAKNAGTVNPRAIVMIEVQAEPPFPELAESQPIPITVR